MPPTFNAQTLPVNDNINPYSFSIQLRGEYFVQKGKMIAYYGQMRFEALSAGSFNRLIARPLRLAAVRAATGWWPTARAS